jgi:serine/threonine-protein kinase
MPAERYSLIRKIGAGGMAEVWKASASGAAGFRKTVAIKRVLPNLGGDPEFVRRFVEEARVAAALVHPNIVQVFDFGELEPGVYFLAMEYVPGINLAGLAVAVESRGRRLPPEVVILAAIETAKALGYAHTRTPPIIHRDVSPQNLLVSFEGDVKLADFGIAKVSGTSTEAQGVRGKVGYLSPEQLAGKPVDPRSDLFSLGIVLFRLLTGRDLFPGVTTAERLAAAGRFRGLSPEDLADVPPPLRVVLRQALAVDPADRFQSAEEMEAELGTCVDSGATILVRRTLASLAAQYFPEERERIEKEASAGTDRAGKSGAATVDIRNASPRSRRSATATLAIAGTVGALLVSGALLGQRFMPFPLFARSAATPSPVATAVPIETPAATPPLAVATLAATPLPAATATPAPATIVAGVTPLRTPAPTKTPAPHPTRVAVAPTPQPATPTPAPAPTARPRIVRQVPKYDATILDGCTPQESALTRASILGAIKRGAPKYNAGDVQGCFEIYRDSAQALRGALPESCPGLRAGLLQGIDRAATLPTAPEKAWAMRDAFDGLLAVLPAP